MSELIQKHDSRTTIRWKLLTGASALVLTAYISSASLAIADDGDHPQIWIELGGQLSRLQDSQEPFAPAFVALTPSNLSPPQKVEKPARYGIDENAALTFQPDGSDWIFSASVRYGRSDNSKHVRQQSNPAAFTAYTSFHRSRNGVYHHFKHYYPQVPIAPRFTEVTAKQGESHMIVDFQAGKDLGIGLFGHNASSALDFGVRFAQFASRSSIKLRENPDWHFKTHIGTFSTAYDTYYGGHYSFYRKDQYVYQPFHSFAAVFQANRSFRGLGPSISWNSSVAVAGNSQRALTFDWGADAAILFGRQKTKIHHQTTARFHSSHAGPSALPITYQHPATPGRTRSHNVIVPNVGGFAGVSFRYANAKVSFGYKADFFFGAIDGGIDTRKSEDRGFFGPFASVSVGIGG